MSLGSLVLFRKMTDEQYDIFIQQLSDTVGFKLDLLRKIISNSIKNGENENILFLRILDAFAGTSITFPKRRQSFQYLDKTFMYTKAKNHNFTEDIYNSIARHHGEKLAVVKNRVLRISRLLDDEEYATLVREQEKLKKKRREAREEKRKLREAKERKDNEEST